MTGPVNGFGGNQLQYTSTFQQNQSNTQIRGDENRQPQHNEVQARNAQIADTQNAETGNQGDIFRATEDAVQAVLASSDNGKTPPRGSVLDVLV